MTSTDDDPVVAPAPEQRRQQQQQPPQQALLLPPDAPFRPDTTHVLDAMRAAFLSFDTPSALLDLHLHCDDGRVLHANKAHLAIHSLFLQEQFSQTTTTTAVPRTTVHLPVSSTTMRDVLHYVYVGDIPIVSSVLAATAAAPPSATDVAAVAALARAAHFLGISRLQRFATETLSRVSHAYKAGPACAALHAMVAFRDSGLELCRPLELWAIVLADPAEYLGLLVAPIPPSPPSPPPTPPPVLSLPLAPLRPAPSGVSSPVTTETAVTGTPAIATPSTVVTQAPSPSSPPPNAPAVPPSMSPPNLSPSRSAQADECHILHFSFESLRYLLSKHKARSVAEGQRLFQIVYTWTVRGRPQPRGARETRKSVKQEMFELASGQNGERENGREGNNEEEEETTRSSGLGAIRRRTGSSKSPSRRGNKRKRTKSSAILTAAEDAAGGGTSHEGEMGETSGQVGKKTAAVVEERRRREEEQAKMERMMRRRGKGGAQGKEGTPEQEVYRKRPEDTDERTGRWRDGEALVKLLDMENFNLEFLTEFVEASELGPRDVLLRAYRAAALRTERGAKRRDEEAEENRKRQKTQAETERRLREQIERLQKLLAQTEETRKQQEAESVQVLDSLSRLTETSQRMMARLRWCVCAKCGNKLQATECSRACAAVRPSSPPRQTEL